MSALTVGELQVLLSGDMSRLNRDMDRIDARAGQTEKVHTAAWGRIGAIAGTALKTGLLLATAATVGVGAALRSTVQIGMEYQDQLNTLGAVSGATAEQMAQVAATAKTLGADLTLPATSAADAAAVMTELAKASFTVEEAQTAAKGSLQLAAAAQIDAARAATIQASALQAFSLDASEAGRVSDVLANAANASAAEITDVADALSQASAVAAATGISIEDTAATIGILANNGIKGSDAGTLLKSALLALQSPSDAAATAMGDLGLTAYDAEGNFVGLSAIFGDLAEAQKRMTPEAYAYATSTLFGSDAARLAGIAGKEGAEGFDAMAAAMGRQGAAAEVAAAKAKGVRGAYEGLTSQVETLKIQGFEALSPAMESVIDKASDMVPVLGQHLFSAMEKAIGAAQELREEFGPELGELGELAAQKWGQFVDLLSELGSAVAPSLPSLIDSLLRIAQVGGEVGEAMLPALEAGLRLAGPAADALAGTLGIVADVLETIEPILPLVVGGFLAFKGLSAATGALSSFQGAIGNLSTRMSNAAINAGVFTEKITGSGAAGERVMTGMGKVGSALSKVGAALPIVGIAVALVGAAMEMADRQTTEWAQALLDGGRAADTARQEMAELEAAWGGLEGTAASAAPGMRGIAELLGMGSNAAANAAEKSRELQAAMTPLQLAQQNVTNRTNELTQAQGDYGVNSWQATAAADALRVAQTNLETKERDLAVATETATAKLLAQTQAAMAGANADLALSMANTQLSTAMETYNTSLADGTLTATQRQQATDAMTQSSLSAAQAAGAQAFAHSTAATEEGKQAEADAALLASLKTTAQQLGTNTPAAITQLIGSLEASAGAASTTATQMGDLGLSVESIPGSKEIRVNAPTADQKSRLEGLGYTVTNIPGSKDVRITAQTADAEAAIQRLLVTRHMTIIANTAPGSTARGASAQNAARQLDQATGGIVHAYADGGFQSMRGGIAQIVPPNTWRVIGDRVKDDEAYIPINQDRRSLAIMSEAARRMGGQFMPGGGRQSVRGGAASTGSASVAGVTNRNFIFNGHVREEMSDKRFIELAERAEWLHG